MTTPEQRNVIYAVMPHQNWVNAAEILKRECGLEPIYWECSSELKEPIKASFPNAVIHESTPATKGEQPEGLDLDSPFNYPLDMDIIEDLANEQLLTLKMMDRIDPGNVLPKETFGYNERVRHYYRLTSYWMNVFDHLNPEVVIFGGTPHLVNDFVLYSVAKKRDVETIIFTNTALPELFYTRKGIFSGFEPSSETDIQNQKIPEEIQSYLKKLSSDYSEAKPDYMRGTNTNFGVKSFLESLNSHFIPSSKSRIKELLFSKNAFRWEVPVDIKFGSGKIEESGFPWIQWAYYLLKSRLYLRKLRKVYDKKATPLSLEEEYIYYPLHYQPERTTSPEGNHYAHQGLVVDLLANCADNLKIYVKEHPSQFDPNLHGQLGRKKYTYDDIASHEQVRLVPLDTDPYELIDNATAVATITGTAGWEAINRGKPAMVFGAAWYQNAPNVYSITTRSDLKRVLPLIRDPNQQNEMSIQDFVKATMSVGYQGKLNESSDHDQAETIARAVTDQIGR